MTNIKFLRVLGIRSKDPGVLATVGDELVTWNPRRGWNCRCLTPSDEFECEHIMTVRDLLDMKVMTPIKMREPRS